MPDSQTPGSPQTTPPPTGWASVPMGPVDASGFPHSQEGLVLVYRGICPRCQHETIFEVSPGYAGEVTKADLAPPKKFVMLCQCGFIHPGHPDDDISCGAYWQYVEQI